MRAQGETLGFDPGTPVRRQNLRFSVHYRGHRLGVSLSQDRISVSTRPGEASPINILVGEKVREFALGMQAEFPLSPPCVLGSVRFDRGQGEAERRR
jgi:trehalose/maltose hydrolase-like predicted phosphorylase